MTMALERSLKNVIIISRMNLSPPLSLKGHVTM